ncbi:unnamed protein product [Blepharisma stoltei]|uniref:Uncharacterized protein n=1 Tax=Blepharisma stoltei TaxID=1481888 RepID=A0AAU9ITD6_9CILI|nr:unnamed protein product [Blepharisma stoltei]
MESSMNTILDASSSSCELYEVDLRTMAYKSNKIKIPKDRRKFIYKTLCQISDEQLLCFRYDSQVNIGRIFYIDNNGKIAHGSWVNLPNNISIRLRAYKNYCKNIKGIKYQNNVYIIFDYFYILRYNLLKNICLSGICMELYKCYSCAIIEDKILISNVGSKTFIYDCSINSISFISEKVLWYENFVGAIDRSFFMITYSGVIMISEELNPYKWNIIGKTTLNPNHYFPSSSFNYGNFAFILCKNNLYKFDLKNVEFKKFNFPINGKGTVSVQNILSLKFMSFTNENNLHSWVHAFRPIKHYFKDSEKNYIESILCMIFQIEGFPPKFAFEYPALEERRVIIINNDYWFDMRSYLKNDPKLFNYQKEYSDSMKYIFDFCIFSLKNWSKQGVIIPDISFMKRNHVTYEEIIETFKNGKKGLIWVLIGKLSMPYLKFINQNEDKAIVSYSPFDHPFRQVNEYLRETGENEIDWKIW